MDRYESNQLIFNKLKELIKKHPYLRFGQLLVNCGILEYMDGVLVIKDIFNEESEITWKRLCSNKL